MAQQLSLPREQQRTLLLYEYKSDLNAGQLQRRTRRSIWGSRLLVVLRPTIGLRSSILVNSISNISEEVDDPHAVLRLC